MSSESQLSLPEELSIANVGEWKKRLSDFLCADSPLSLNASALSRVDTAAIQMLSAFIIQVRSSGQEFSWVEPSETLKSTAKCLGMSEYLALG